MPVFSRSAALICIVLSLITACGSQESLNTNNLAAASKTANTHTSSSSSGQTDSGLLQSLAVLYPNGQLPANRAAQASQDLSQNPAALKLTAETAYAAKGQSTANTANTPIATQAVAADYQPVQRVQNNTLYGAYFFSIYPTEITTALAANPNWRLEGPAFWASLATGTDLFPVHRFRNKTNGSYLYSIYETERANIAANYAATFEYEGVAWHARQTLATGWSALYRFRNKTNGTYLFSAYESEKDAIVATYPDVFVLEGIAYYVRQDAQPNLVTLAGPARVIANTIYSYSATVYLATASAWSWLWGDGSANGSTNPTNKVWYKPGSYTTSVTTTANGAPASASQTVTVVGDPIVSGFNHSCALKPDGTVSCWGYNGYGQLGDGSTAYKSTPTAVPGLTGVAALTAGDSHSCALKTDGTVSCWGRAGQIGDGSATNRLSPTAVPGLTGVVALAAGSNHSCALKTDGTVSCWGNNEWGQLGDGTTTGRLSPAAVPGLTGVMALAAGRTHSCALKTDGTVSCWGSNTYGEQGNGSTGFTLSRTAALGLTGVVALAAGDSHSCALKTDGTVSCWGWNVYGQLGDGSTTNRPNPTAVPGLTGVAALMAGTELSCALKADGTVSCWGNNASGQLGDGSTTNRLSPTAVPALTGVAALTAGSGHSCALKTDGVARCWGSNGAGQLGDGSTINRLNNVDVLGGAVFWK